MTKSVVQRLRQVSRKKVVWFVVSACIVFLTWTFSSPPGSSPDEFFHVGSAYCVFGESDNCKFTDYTTDYYRLWAEIPYSGDPCFEQSPEIPASCESVPRPQVQKVPVDNGTRNYPLHYYWFANLVLRLGADIGIPLLRIVNALIGLTVLLAALHFAEKRLVPGIVSAVVVLVVPQGFFILASVNPSSWAFTGVSFSWVFLHRLITNRNDASNRKRLAVAGYFVMTVILASARYDSIFLLIVLNAAVLFLYWDRQKQHSRKLVIGSSLLLFGVLVATNSKLDYVVRNVSKMFSNSEFFGFARYWAIHFVEIPLTSLGLNYGNHGPTGIVTPPLVGHIQFGFLASAMVLAALERVVRQRLFFVAISLVLFLAILQQVSADGETGFYMVQGRYFLPLLVGATGVFVALSESPVQLVKIKSIRSVLITGLSIAHLLTLFVFVRRYSTGYDNDYRRFELNVFKNFGLPTGWRYIDAVSPIALIIIGSIAYFVFISLLLQHSDSDGTEDLKDEPRETNAPRYSVPK